MNATATWNNDGDPSALPPPAVVVEETCTAFWKGDSGSCDNSFGDPITSSSGGQSQAGMHYRMINDPGNSFPLSRTPHAKGVKNPYYPVASAGVGWIVTIYDIGIQVNGVININNNQSALVGDAYSAQIVGLPNQVTPSNFTWGIPGDLYNSWTADIDSATLDNNVNLQVESPTWRWSCGGGGNPLADGPHGTEITVAADLTASGQSIGRVSLYTSVDV